MLLSMTKVEIIGPKKYFYEVLGLLHRLGTLQLEDLSKKIVPGDMFMRKMEIDRELQERKSILEELVVKVNAIMATLDLAKEKKYSREEREKIKAERKQIYERLWHQKPEELAKEVSNLIDEVEAKTRTLALRRTELEAELTSLSKYETIVEKIQPLAKQLVVLEGFETIAILIEQKYKATLEMIRKELVDLTKNQFEIVSVDVDNETTAALIVFNKTYAEKVHNFLWSGNVNEVRLPDDLADQPYDVALDKLRERKQNIPSELEVVKKDLEEISKNWHEEILVIQEILQDRLREMQAIPQFGQTDFTFVISGWMPKKYLQKSRDILKKDFGERVILEETEVTPHELEEAPVMYENKAFVKPFEMIMKVFSPPRYGTIDPTPFLAIFFPLFFGMIVGDAGYGLIILLVSLWAKNKYKNVIGIQAVTSIFTIASMSVIFFGFIYGEFLGDLPHKFHLIREFHILGVELPIKRAEAMMPLLYLTLGVGSAHIFFGLILGVVNALREKARKHAMEKGGMLIALFGIFMLVALSAQVLPEGLKTPSYGILLIGIVLLVYSAGMLGPLEIFGVLGKIISYARIMALGLAGVILADVANKLATSMGNIVIGIMIAGLLHSLNLIVSVFSPSIHAMRLNFIEFFGQFYEGGGHEYKPFKKSGGE
ncbi:MAG: V-type ATP synthase subunit I [Actinobacteria bacterium]|nr:V-type ATP synthase subunit I [Actinomycetota bacterium]